MTDIFSGRASVRLNVAFPQSDAASVTETGTVSSAPDPSPAANDSVDTPLYSMSRASNMTVRDLWREWSEGLGGGPAVSVLEQRWKRKWRPSNTETKFFSRRKKIIDLIVAKKDRIGLERALEEIESIRVNRGVSLDGLRVLIENQEI